MTDAPAPALAPIDLGTFEGVPVLRTSVAITNAGDGLSTALKTEPSLLHHGQTVYVVLECEVADVAFVPVKDMDGFNRRHKLRAGVATIMDSSIVKEAIDAQREANRVAREREAGIQSLFGLESEHGRGEHELFPHKECPECQKAEGDDATAKGKGRKLSKS